VLQFSKLLNLKLEITTPVENVIETMQLGVNVLSSFCRCIFTVCLCVCVCARASARVLFGVYNLGPISVVIF